jgi:hypothetical protein
MIAAAILLQKAGMALMVINELLLKVGSLTMPVR